jgi:hypothetical protein
MIVDKLLLTNRLLIERIPTLSPVARRDPRRRHNIGEGQGLDPCGIRGTFAGFLFLRQRLRGLNGKRMGRLRQGVYPAGVCPAWSSPGYLGRKKRWREEQQHWA